MTGKISAIKSVWQVFPWTSNAGESLLLLLTIFRLVDGFALGIYVDGHFGHWQLAARLYHRHLAGQRASVFCVAFVRRHGCS